MFLVEKHLFQSLMTCWTLVVEIAACFLLRVEVIHCKKVWRVGKCCFSELDVPY